MLKKMMLLAMAVGALVAFAAPAAQADEWYTGEETIGTTTQTGDAVEFTGLLKFTLGNNTLGPCLVHAQTILWNDNGNATGEVVGFQITGPCDVQVHPNAVFPTAFCSATPTAQVSAEEPWHVNIDGETGVQILGANFTNHFSAGCQSIGFPSTITATATEAGATAQAVNRVTGEEDELCLVFNESGHFNNGVRIDGEVCAPGLTVST